jgi:diguanylate cyclase (GGDEF)-like protein/PAS domain S-box-containing protein
MTAREEQRLGARLRRSEAYFRSLVRSSSDAVVILDDELRMRWASPALGRVLGERAEALVGAPLLAEVHPDDAGPLHAALVGLPGSGAADEAGLLLVRLPDASGAWRHLEVGISDLRHDADVGAVVLHCRDMTERNARERALTSVAYTDPRTGLPNRAGWARAVDAAAAGGHSGALLLVELDGLPEAREHAGGEVVAELVAEIGRRLRATVRGEDVVARLGGGEFAVLAQGSAAETERLADRCLAVVELPIATRAGILEVTAAIGIAVIEPGVPADELRARAELAVRAAKEAGSARVTGYDVNLGAAAARRERLRADLEGARVRGEMSLVFQPVVSTQQRRVGGAEALLRWRHPELGDLPPEEFLPIAERAGLTGDLHRWVLREAMTAITGLPVGDQPDQLGVNLSAAYLAGGTAVPDVEQALRASGLPAERLVVEITEAAAGSPLDSVALDITALRLMGVSVALDDFGTGQSALGSLTRVQLDVLKLDPSLVTRIDRDKKVLALCESVVGIGRALGLKVVAEGVETPAQLGALCGIGCDGVQGFLLGRPVPIERIAEVVREDSGVLWPGLVGSG